MGRNGTNKDIKKGTEGGYDERNCRRGRQSHQSLKTYWILQYLINNATETEPVTAGTLQYELEDRGINADRKSIYRDIREINIINYMLENEDADVFDAEEAIDNDVDGSERLVLYQSFGKKKGYYVSRRNYDEIDIQLIVESIYSSRFLTEKQSERLANIACRVISEGEATNIKHQVDLLDRRKTDNKQVLRTINTINEAMSDVYDGEKKMPCQISFYEIATIVANGKPKKVKRNLEVSPHYLAIYEGKYYLIYYAKGVSEWITVENEEEVYAVTNYDFFSIELSKMEDVICLYDKPIYGKAEFEKLKQPDLISLLDGTYNQKSFSEEHIIKDSKIEPVTLFVTTWTTEKLFDRYGNKSSIIGQINDYCYVFSKVFKVDNYFFDFVIENFPDIIVFGMSEQRQKEFTEYLKEKHNKLSRMLEIYKDGINEEEAGEELERTVNDFLNGEDAKPIILSKEEFEKIRGQEMEVEDEEGSE